MAYSPSNPPLNCAREVDTSVFAGKTAVVTGGASGLSEAYVRALAAASVAVVIADVDPVRGSQLSSQLTNTRFVHCDVRKWEDQVRVFEEAAKFSRTGRLHYVVTNAGDGPAKPDLITIDINLQGTLFTTKLATHYFIKQNGTTQSNDQEDTCLVLIGSGAAFLDCPRGPCYQATKWASRGIMHSLRRTSHFHGSRVNMISPWYVQTNILTPEAFDHVRRSGVDLASAEDGGRCLLRILSDRSINGRSLFLSPKKWASSGYIDLDIDEYMGNERLQEIQADQIKSAPIELGLFGASDY
ncbi:hypothetical protein M409DRAFT_65432 [Zasmidium cellare ATCC 36951]|uniref:Uncharacterized protein n=1 Tax=Zasmidium cellare ATCC 36951 TaxID=1080233 RepID=A0A6A6CP66_ZASCE|nr:uncharacterized protein M409DRAFT_65432 [Zasmidium cellare ATCC 36951]KAF2168453.1 hypothetical protein M409DRAFT_65432 [Zasmidium cellare ATCC 36951]